MIFNMMSYGGAGNGDPDDNYAVWRVTYPAGSTCTCTKGTEELEAPDASGSVFFYIPESGQWQVSCTDGSKIASAIATFNASTRIKDTTLSYGVEPTPTPTPTDTKIIAFSNSYSGVFACMENGGSEYTDGPYQGASYTFTLPEAGSYLITFVYSVGGAAQTKQYFVNVAEGETKRINMDSGAITTDGSSDSGSDTPTPTPSATTGTIRAIASSTGVFNFDDGNSRVPVQGTSATWTDVAPGRYMVVFVSYTAGNQYNYVDVVAGETVTVRFN